MNDIHAVFVKLTDGTSLRLTPWLDWHDAIDRWTLLDDIRREHLRHETYTNVAYFAVRQQGDGQWDESPYAFQSTEHAKPILLIGKGAHDWKAPTRRLGNEDGYHGREGGWIYTSTGRVVTQGWWEFFDLYRKARRLVRYEQRYFVNQYGSLLKSLQRPSPIKEVTS